MRRSASPAAAGFTLIELAVVLLILGVGLAVAVPALPRARAGEERVAADLAALLASGRREAAARGGEATVAVDLVTGAYRVSLRRGREAGDSTLRAGAIGGWAETPLAHRGGDSLLVARFDPLGHAGAAPLRWQREDGSARELRVDPWTGEVRVAAP